MKEGPQVVHKDRPKSLSQSPLAVEQRPIKIDKYVKVISFELNCFEVLKIYE